MTWHRESGLLPFLIPGLLLAATSFSCEPKFEKLGLHECPHQWPFGIDTTRTPDRGLVIDTVGLADVGRQTHIAEFNDCQRFVVRDAASDELRFDEYFAIFATPRLSDMGDSLATFAPPHGPKALVAAIIYAEGVYDPLGITTQFSCLYLYIDSLPINRTRWRALLVPKGDVEPTCSTPIDPQETNGARLTVWARDMDGFADPADYPPVARWDWDATREQQYIGVKCGAAWCEIGSADFRPSPIPPVQGALTASTGSISRVELRGRTIKGWYDEQILAVPATRDTVAPGPIVGRIYPYPGLEKHETNRAFSQAGWHEAAYVTLERTPWAQPAEYLPALHHYRDKYGFDAGGVSIISLCHGDRSTCHITPSAKTTSCPMSAWWAKVESAAGRVTFHCITRHDHAGFVTSIPATVRWRWHARDEGWWTPCELGCCQDGCLQPPSC